MTFICYVSLRVLPFERFASMLVMDELDKPVFRASGGAFVNGEPRIQAMLAIDTPVERF